MVPDNNRNEVEDYKLTVQVPETAHQVSTGTNKYIYTAIFCVKDCSFFCFFILGSSFCLLFVF